MKVHQRTSSSRGRWGLRTRLLLPVALLVLLGGGGWGVIGELSARRQMEELAGRRGTTVLEGIGQRLQERQRSQELFAALLADQASVGAALEKDDPVDMAQVVAPVQARLGLGRVTVYVQDGQAGRELLHMGPRQVGLAVAPLVASALSGLTESAVAVTGQGLAVVAASPIRGHGTVQGALVVGTTLDGDALNEVTDRQGVALAVFRGDRLVGTTADRPEVVQVLHEARISSGGIDTLDSALAHLNYQVAVKELPDQGLLLALVSTQDLMDASTQRNVILVGGTLALLGAVLAAGLLLARDIAQPLASMGVATGGLLRGNFQQRVAPSSIRELDELGEAINHLGQELRIQHAQLAGERGVLEQVTRGEPLAHILNGLCGLVEQQADHVSCVVLLTDEGGDHLHVAAAPGLSARDRDAIDSLVACWSTPIRSSQDDLLGSLALYSAAPHDPGPAELRMLTSAAGLAGIAIERDRAQAALSEGAKRLNLALEAAGLAAWEWDIPSDRINGSAHWLTILGSEPSTFRQLLDVLHPDDRPTSQQAIEHAQANHEAFSVEWRIMRPDGVVRWCVCSGQVIADADGQAVRLAGVLMDITLRKEAEITAQALAQSEKLRALGQMASGIAHDLNQSLMLILSYSDLARRQLAEGSPDREEVRELLAAAAQAALDGGESVKRLLVFARAPNGDAARLPVDLSALARDVAQLTAPRWGDWAQAEGRPINLQVQAHGQPVILGSPARLRDALTNLLFNAVDALPHGGTITLRTAEEGGQAILELMDSGVGMTPDVQAKIFEPFFTTKGESGTGLGLAMVFGIVQQHAGRIEVRSAPGAGTCFRLSFPLALEAAAAVPARNVAVANKVLRPLRVLAVDDEPAMTRAVVRMLRPAGHAVGTAASADEALERLAVEGFDVVVSDMGMGPGMNGLELAEHVRRRWPGLRFVLATGWGAAIDPAEVRARGVDAVLAKPYRLADLERLLIAPPDEVGTGYEAA